jgi:hypothetical protein
MYNLFHGLTLSEHKEFTALKEQLFKGDMFVEFPESVTNTIEFKRYEELLQKKMNYLKKKTPELKNLRNFTS